MRKHILVLCMVAGLGNVAAAAPGSFQDVPPKHWAYGAVSKLAAAGIIAGEAEFRGDKLISRYEMAVLVAKAMDSYNETSREQRQMIDKLTAEFSPELTRLGARVTKVEEKTKIEIHGETRFRFSWDKPAQSQFMPIRGGDKFDFRQRIIFRGNINDKISWQGRIATGANRPGNMEYLSSGSEISLDLANVTVRDTAGFDSIRIGRSLLDFYSNGLIGKAFNTDGILLTKSWKDWRLQAFTGNTKPANGLPAGSGVGDSGDANTFTSGQLTFTVNDRLTLRSGYYWADMPAVAKKSINIASGSYASSKGANLSYTYKMGELYIIGDYIQSSLDKAVGLPKNPRGYVVELTNTKGQKFIYPVVNLVNPRQVNTDAWMISYRSLDPGAVPFGCAGFGFSSNTYSTNVPYNVTTFNSDNVNVLYLAYQKVIAANTIISLEYQDYKIKHRSLTGNDLSSSNLDKTFVTKIEYYY